MALVSWIYISFLIASIFAQDCLFTDTITNKYELDLRPLQNLYLASESNFKYDYTICVNNLRCLEEWVMIRQSNLSNNYCHQLATFNNSSPKQPSYDQNKQIWRFNYSTTTNTNILYHCNETIDKAEISNIVEIGSCEYNIYIETKLACIDTRIIVKNGSLECITDCTVNCHVVDCYGLSLIEVEEDVSLYLSCSGYGCHNMYIDAETANIVNIECIVTVKGITPCKNIIILGRFIKEYIKYDSIGDYASINITIYGEESNKIAINGQGVGSFIHSSIYSQNATNLMVTCYNRFDRFDSVEAACNNTKIYLSVKEGSNTLNCKYGCKNIQLYFENDINVSVFNNISFAECNACPNNGDCIDEWIIYFSDYNESIIYYRSGDNVDDRFLPLSDYVDKALFCSLYEDILFNEYVAELTDIISIIFGISCILLLLIVIKDLLNKIINIHRKVKYRKFISKRPSSAILQYSILADIVIFLGIIWWFIRITLLYDAVFVYCTDKYSHPFDVSFCDDDIWCEYRHYEHSGNHYCTTNDLLIDVTICWWFFIFFLTTLSLICFIRDCLINLHECCRNGDTNCVCCLDQDLVNICDFCVCLFCRYSHIIHEGHYEKRKLWISGGLNDANNVFTKCCVGGQCNFYGYLCLHFFRYGIYVILTWIIVICYDNFNSDFIMKWYEFYPILMLLFMKIILQIIYTFGPKYDENEEIIPMINEILQDTFGDIGNIIKMYLPRFHHHDKSIPLTTMRV